MAIEVGLQPIPGYTLTRPLGKGAFGQVWEGVAVDGSAVAMKFLDTHHISRDLIASEVRLFRALTEWNHPAIMPLLGVHAAGKFIILVMELADGNLEDLRQAYVRQTGGHIPVDHALELLAQAAEALDFLAQARLGTLQGLQHCDIKPSNLLLVGNKLKVADFGLCASTGTQTHRGGGWRGTLPYAAPELFNGRPAPGTDQFALAVTFCEVAIGDRCFTKESAAGIPGAMPIDLTQLREKEFPIVARALHQYPSARWPSCKAFVQELRKVNQAPRAASRIFPRGVRGSLRLCAM